MEFKLIDSTEEDTYTFKAYDIVLDDAVIGAFQVLEDENSTYLERIDINEKYRSKGYGKVVIEMIKDEFSKVYAAPDNDRSKKFFENIGNQTNLYGEVDQGWGVYIL